MFSNLDLIFIDADDTLWYDHVFFRRLYYNLMEVGNNSGIKNKEIQNCFKYNVKNSCGEIGFINAVRKTGTSLNLPARQIIILETYIDSYISHPIELFPNSRETLKQLSNTGFHLVLYTKGLYEEQQKKITRSGLENYFTHRIIIPQKNTQTLTNLGQKFSAKASEVLVIGNSIKDDIIPACEYGAHQIWFNHEENHHGRNAFLPKTAIEVKEWKEIKEILLPDQK